MKKPHPLKGRPRSAEAIAKSNATRAANKLRREQGETGEETASDRSKIKDAIVYLTNANRKFADIIKPGREMPAAQLLVMLALRTLRGDL